ncbi:MAG: alpha-ketoacid dehydrogenase subunit beta [Alphaproteobacteria bacterium]|nr:alpha-ketoacid dehydrogenase subunit beta [Alphaproteobacteria bacterium]MCY4496620.1 alpha-ketoacid dehydrogenase subunit beta [Rhodospirillaceae bacterium]
MSTLTIRDALHDAIHEEMERDESVFVIGEDVVAHGGPYTVTEGIAERFPDRIFETPIAEAGIVGVGVGAAMAGMRPVVEIMYLDFITCAMDEVVNQAAKMRYMTGGQASVPLVIRLPCGLGRYIAAQHSQIMESWFMHVPGLQVVVPSTPKDAKGLLKTAVRSPDPVLFFEYKRIYTAEGEVPDEEYLIPFGEAETKREGEDVTVVAVGPMVGKALKAGVILEDDGYDIEVVDPRTLSPLDTETIRASVGKTGRAVICEEDSSFAGTGAEIAAMIAENCFKDLQAPVVRVGMPHVPMPFAPPLADSVVPQVDSVVDAVRRVMA